MMLNIMASGGKKETFTSVSALEFEFVRYMSSRDLNTYRYLLSRYSAPWMWI